MSTQSARLSFGEVGLNNQTLKTFIHEQVFGISKAYIENARKPSFYEWKMMIFEFLLGFCSLVCVLLCLIIYQLRGSPEMEMIIINLKMLVSFFTLISTFFTVFAKLGVWKLTEQPGEPISARFMAELVLSILFLLPHPSYWTHGVQASQLYDLDDILIIFVLFRVLTVSKVLFHFLSYYGTRCMRISQVFGSDVRADFGFLYAIKCFFKQNEKSSLIALFMFNLLIVGQMIYICESPGNPSLSDWSSQLYFSLVAMSTVGYGQLTPKTTPGKLFVALLIIIGSVLSAFFIIYTLKLLEFNEPQLRSYSLQKRLEHREQVNRFRQNYISEILRRRKSRQPLNLFIKLPALKSHYNMASRYNHQGSRFMTLLQSLSQKLILTNTLITIITDKLMQKQQEPTEVKHGLNRRQDNQTFSVLYDVIFKKHKKQKLL